MGKECISSYNSIAQIFVLDRTNFNTGGILCAGMIIFLAPKYEKRTMFTKVPHTFEGTHVPQSIMCSMKLTCQYSQNFNLSNGLITWTGRSEAFTGL